MSSASSQLTLCLFDNFGTDYFSRKPAYLWTNVVDKELIELMPDIVGRPRIHVDPVILVIYYCILYNECAFSETPSSNPNESEIIKSCYIGCTRSLQLWQREASGSLSDFIAALCIVGSESPSNTTRSSPCRMQLAHHYHRPK